MNYKYLFGPVISRRLGISLGIDIISFKTCSLDCVYCECGSTTFLTLERKEYVPTEEVILEINDYLKNRPKLDCITFSGSGEPTLHKDIGKIADYIKKNHPVYKTALLTNGTLLWNKKVRKDIKNIDLILPSLDAISEEAFNKINRPSKKLKIKKIVNGIINLRKKYKGRIWLEIFFIPGINDNEKELNLFINTLRKIRPDKIQLNSLDRPGAEDWVTKEKYENLIAIKNSFKEFDNVEIIARYDNTTKLHENEMENTEYIILTTLKRRPCSLSDLLKITNIDAEELKILLNKLISRKVLTISCLEGNEFYMLKKED